MTLIKNELTLRFAGDSGDGMQLVGKLFARTAASHGFDVSTFPDFPSEIRAPAGTLYGVSAFQIQLGSHKINTPGDKTDILIVMNPSALKVNLPNLKKDGLIIINSDTFNSKNLKLAGYEANLLEDKSLCTYQTIICATEGILKKACENLEISIKPIRKSKNFFALGLALQLFSMPIEDLVQWIKAKFAKDAESQLANLKALESGWNFALSNSHHINHYKINQQQSTAGNYRNITGNHAVALGLVAASHQANLPLFLGSYPITPATDILHHISGYKKYGIKHMQAEDEIAGISSAIGAAFGGYLAATTTSGPGLSLKSEALGLAVMTELPLVVIDVMRAGPSTGLPTKPEQSDLFQAMYGRHGEAPMPVLCASGAADCFKMTVEAARLAVKYMTPVILLTDGYIAQGAEPWKIPSEKALPKIESKFAQYSEDFAPYRRNKQTLARNWAIPGQAGMEHRIGGLEKQDITGNVSHDPLNHQKMTDVRQQKIAGIAQDIPPMGIEGEPKGKLLLLTWGSTYGAAKTAWNKLSVEGYNVSFANLSYLNPLPANTEEVLNGFEQVLLPEMNMGQLQHILQGKFLKPILGMHKVQGQPFKAEEIENKVKELLGTSKTYEHANTH